MTTYTLATGLPFNGSGSLSQYYVWEDTALWAQGSVPDDSSAQVVLNNIGDEGYTIAIGARDIVTIGSLAMPSNRLAVGGMGSLTAAGDISLSSAIGASGKIVLVDGFLYAQSLHLSGDSSLSGWGGVTVLGSISNNATILADGSSLLVLDAGSFANAGVLWASGGTLRVETATASGFTNDVYGTLTGGTYRAQYGGTVDLKTPGLIHSLSAHLSYFDSGTIASYDPASAAYVPLQQSLSLITHAGELDLEAAAYATTGSLTVAGSVQLLGTSSLSVGGVLYITAQGELDFLGTTGSGQQITAHPVVDDGLISVDGVSGGIARIYGQVQGSGEILLQPAGTVIDIHHQSHTTIARLELGQADWANLAFSDNSGQFILDQPASIHGSFENFQAGDQILLRGIDAASVTALTYAGTASSGVLSVHEGGTVLQFRFAGDYSAGDFAFEANPNGAGTLLIGVAPHASA